MPILDHSTYMYIGSRMHNIREITIYVVHVYLTIERIEENVKLKPSKI